MNLGAVVGVGFGHTAWGALRAPLEMDGNSERGLRGRGGSARSSGVASCVVDEGLVVLGAFLGRVVHEVAGCTLGSSGMD